MKGIASFSFLILLVFTACKPGDKKTGNKYEAVFAKHQARITDIRNYLSGLTSSIKEAGTTVVPIGTQNPVINLGDNDTTGNTLILQYHLLSSPESFTSSDSLFGLYYNPLAAGAFKWTGTTKDRMVFEQDYLKDEDVDNKIAPLSTDRFPYLLIVKATSFTPLTQKQDGAFEGGGATASYYLYDWKNKKELSSISLSASPDAEMLYAYQSKDGSAGQIEAAADKAKEIMQKNMRTKVYEWLKEISGGAIIVPKS